MTSTIAPPPIRPFWASFHLIRSRITPMCSCFCGVRNMKNVSTLFMDDPLENGVMTLTWQ